MAQPTARPLLTYSVSTSPAPLRMSDATPAPGEVTIVVHPAPSVRCQFITIKVPIGEADNALFRMEPKAASTEWVYEPLHPNLDLIGAVSFLVLPSNYATFHFPNPDREAHLLTGELRIILRGIVSARPDTAQLEVTESSAAASEKSFSSKKITFDMPKTAAADLYIKNFYAGVAQEGGGLLPVTEYANSTAIHLSWESNGTAFEVYRKGEATPIPTGPGKTCTIDGGLLIDTTFILHASLVPEGSANASHLYEALTITVSNPSLTPKEIHVKGPAIIDDKLAVKGPVAIDDKLAVKGPVAIDDKLAVSGSVTIAGSNVLEFGAGVAEKEQSAGKIGYGTFDNGASLNIVGAGTKGDERKIRFWNEGGASFTGNINLDTQHDLTLADWNHGIGYYGGEKYWEKGEYAFLNYSPNGPVVYGWNGGVLGSTAGGKKSVLVWKDNGNVGIGTKDPTAKLDVEGNVRVSGNVGIGTANPSVPLEVESTRNYGTGKHNYFDGSNNVSNSNGGGMNASIFAHGDILCKGAFRAISDARLKTITGPSDATTDLARLCQLCITDYTMRDRMQFGGQPFKKLIAQELEEVFPQAVQQHTGFLPDIYARPSQVQQQGDALLLTLPAGLPEAATAGQRLKLIGPAGEVVATLAEAAEAGSQQLVVAGATSLANTPNEVFIFGLECPDVRTVDYDAVAMLNVSATQALARQVEELHQQNAALHAQCQTQGTQLNELRAALHLLQQQVAGLLRQPAGVALPV